MSEVRQFLNQHLQGIFDHDMEAYHRTTVPELTLYEWYVTPHRIDGLPFHDFMMSEAARDDTAGMALDPNPHSASPTDKARVRFDLANYTELIVSLTRAMTMIAVLLTCQRDLLVFVENDFLNWNIEHRKLESSLHRPRWAEQLFVNSDFFRLSALSLNLFSYGFEFDPHRWNHRRSWYGWHPDL